MTTLRAEADASLSARVISRTALVYGAGADAALDRAPYVRAASSLNRFGDELAVIQDDANFLALIRLEPFTVRAVAFARGHEGMRLFDSHEALKVVFYPDGRGRW